MRLFFLLIAFGAAIWAIGDGWAALREAWRAPTTAGVASVLAYLVVFTAAFLYIGFAIYAADRAAGRVRRPMKLYERILVKRGREGGERNKGRTVTVNRDG
jgi:Na+-driven multidrug efflux pump